MVRNDQRYYMYYPRIQAVCQAPFRVLSPLPALRRQKSKPCILQSRLAYAIMPIGKRNIYFHWNMKIPRAASLGIFYS